MLWKGRNVGYELKRIWAGVRGHGQGFELETKRAQEVKVWGVTVALDQCGHQETERRGWIWEPLSSWWIGYEKWGEEGTRGDPGVLIKQQCGCHGIYWDREGKGENRLALCMVYQSWIDKSKEMSNLNCIFLPDTKGEIWARAKDESTFSLFSIIETQGIDEVVQVGTEEWRKNCGEGLIWIIMEILNIWRMVKE